MEFKNYIKQAGLDSKQYQQVGVDWCLEREHSRESYKGGIIADEMGLGKTITMIGTTLVYTSASQTNISLIKKMFHFKHFIKY